MKKQSLLGKQFGRLTVIEVGPLTKQGKIRWRCRCACGGELLSVGGNLQSGNTKSCGCLRVEVTVARNKVLMTTHGGSYSAIYAQYRGMIARCAYKGAGSYKYYGGRGIRVCARWRGRKGFQNFCDDMGPRPSSVHSVERRDGEGHYDPKNCFWATPEQQAQNKRNTIRLVYSGEEMSLRKACRLHGTNYHTVLQRVWRGWAPERAVAVPIGGAR